MKIGFEGVFPAVLLYYHPFVFQYCNEVCQPVFPKHDTDRGIGFPQFFRKLLVAVFIFECECRFQCDAVLLLCDEPTGALDSVSSREVLRMLAEVNEAYHTTIVMITHNEGIAQMADRVVRIHDGQIISNLKQQKKKVEELEI